MALRTGGYDIAHAQCECPAGIGPHGSCKHIAALSYTLADFALPDYWFKMWKGATTDTENSSTFVAVLHIS